MIAVGMRPLLEGVCVCVCVCVCACACVRVLSSLSFTISFYSYSKDVPAADRLSQVNNSELLVIRPNTGLMYRDAIAQLKNISTELSRCASDQPCPVRIVSLSIPSPSDFNLSAPRYQQFACKLTTCFEWLIACHSCVIK